MLPVLASLDTGPYHIGGHARRLLFVSNDIYVHVVAKSGNNMNIDD